MWKNLLLVVAAVVVLIVFLKHKDGSMPNSLLASIAGSECPIVNKLLIPVHFTIESKNKQIFHLLLKEGGSGTYPLSNPNVKYVVRDMHNNVLDERTYSEPVCGLTIGDVFFITKYIGVYDPFGDVPPLPGPGGEIMKLQVNNFTNRPLRLDNVTVDVRGGPPEQGRGKAIIQGPVPYGTVLHDLDGKFRDYTIDEFQYFVMYTMLFSMEEQQKLL